jgi:LPXTG-motif cell wall-anchored protein
MRKHIIVTGAIMAAALIPAAMPALATNNQHSDHKVGICHATGSKTNPYVYIVVDKHAVDAHRHHQDGRDIIDVKSAKDCAKPCATVKPSPTPSVSPSPSPTPKTGGNGGETLGTSTEAATELPKTGAGLSTLLGVPALAGATAAYLRSRKR